MKKVLKVVAWSFSIAALGACSTATMESLNKDLAKINDALSGKTTAANSAGTGGSAAAPIPSVTMATPTPSTTQTQLIVPTDTKTKTAVDEALPVVKKILAIHQCVKVDSNMLQLNFYTVPGVSMGDSFYNYPNNQIHMKYHDRNKCVSVKAIDSWIMPALNALQFRAVYFAEDSGETINFSYLMKKAEDGAWKLQQINRAY